MFFLGAANFISAQTVSGTIIDDASMPLPGVTIIIKGTTTGTTSDFDGNFSITASNGDVLVFSYVGFDTQEVTISGSTVNVIRRSWWLSSSHPEELFNNLPAVEDPPKNSINSDHSSSEGICQPSGVILRTSWWVLNLFHHNPTDIGVRI